MFDLLNGETNFFLYFYADKTVNKQEKYLGFLDQGGLSLEEGRKQHEDFQVLIDKAKVMFSFLLHRPKSNLKNPSEESTI